MPGQRTVLNALLALFLALPLQAAQDSRELLRKEAGGREGQGKEVHSEKAPGKELRLLFTGDILLSRQVQDEWTRRRQSPWGGFVELFRSADWVGGNLEGVRGEPAACVDSKSPCFPISSQALALLAEAGFAAVTQENNHAGDLGPDARRHTYAALAGQGVLGLDFARSPQFFRRGETTIALISLSLVPAADGQVQQIPSLALAQKLRLAGALANLVVVSVHWGQELVDWPNAQQRSGAAWLVRNGADLVLGHHPHVVQPAECVAGKPVFFSLGNHLFDQKYPQTKQGAIADCRVSGGKLACTSLATRTPPGSTYPQLLPESPAAALDCAVNLRADLSLDGVAIRPQPWSAEVPTDTLALEGWKDGKRQWRSRRQRILSLQRTDLAGAGQPPLLFTLEQHDSPLDMASGVRPYVYAVGPHGLVAKWRGSALAWPLLDAVAEPTDDGSLLCALHRGDSFVVLDPQTKTRRTAAYRWNGFGFSGEEGTAGEICARRYADAPP